MPPDENHNQLSEEDLEVLKRMIQREKAISWLSGSLKYIAGWFVVVVGAWALFAKTITDWILTTTGNGPLN